MTSSRLVRLIGCLFVVLLCALAAAPTTPDGKAIVTVAKTDGSSVRGTITASDPDNVTLQPLAKVGKPTTAPAAEPEPVVIAWHDIKNVSNGLTQRKALDAWKIEHSASLCPTCRGERTVYCPTCKGTGHDPASGKDCKQCKGELLIDCKTPHCDHGQIPCPAKCLQRGVGNWYKKPDGTWWRRFPVGNGFAEYSEHHIGHTIALDPKTGFPNDTGTCPVCNGTTKIDDPACHGSGKTPCPTCVARKDAPPCPDHCDHGRVKCPECKGGGLKSAA
jgi:hypothetical protein